MCRCNFCNAEFENSQGVKAHLRRCELYQQSKKATARSAAGILPSVSGSQTSSATDLHTTASTVFTNFIAQITSPAAGPDEATQLRQKREALLADLCTRVIDWYRPPDGVVTPEMAVAAKVAIRDELGTLAIDELTKIELTLRGEAIRNRVFTSYFRRQRLQAERQHAKQQQDARRIQHEIDSRARHATRKTALIELGVTRALKSASSRAIPSPALVLLEWEVRARLDALLIGDETEQQVGETLAASIDGPLHELEARGKLIKSAKRERFLNDCLTLAVPVAEATWPWVKDTVITKLCQQFGLQSPSQSTEPRKNEGVSPEKPTTSDAPAPNPVRRHRSRSPGPTVDSAGESPAEHASSSRITGT
jgi:hypothetical protein